MLSSLTLSFLFIFAVDHIQGSELDVYVNQYTGIKRSEVRPIEQRFYFFQFCACPSSVNLKTQPSSIDKCSCSNLEKGKQILHSVPNAKFQSSRSRCVAGSCLKAAIRDFDDDSFTKLFVKVAAGSKTLTRPEFQLVTIKKTQNEALLTTEFKSKIRMTYNIDVILGQDSSSSEEDDDQDNKPANRRNQIWNNKILNDQNGEAKGFFKNLAEQKSFILKKNQPTTSTNIKMENEIKRMTSMSTIKSFLFSRSRIDRKEPTSYDIQKLKNSIVSYHNSYRAGHGSGSLSVDSTLESRGKRWADELAFKKGCLIHEQPRVYGENLFFFGARFLPDAETLAQAVVQSFYLEGVGYNYSSWKPVSYYKTGHFTQLIWKKSTKIGVGVTITKIVKYDPAGNFDTFKEYTSNVRPPIA